MEMEQQELKRRQLSCFNQGGPAYTALKSVRTTRDTARKAKK